MKKSTKIEKFNRAFKDIDYAQLISDLKKTELFTESDVAQALKMQKKGISVNVNYVFYSKVVQPLMEKLGDLVEIKKIGGTRFYTIMDRNRAIEVFKKSEKKAETPLPMVLPKPAIPDPIPVATSVEKTSEPEPEKKNESEAEGLTIEKIDRAFRLNPKNKYGFKKRFLGMIAVYGCMYRNNEPKTLSSIPKNVLMKYYSATSYRLDELVAEFNTAVRTLDYPYITKNSGVKRAHKYSVDVSPRKILKLLREIGSIYFNGDKEVEMFLDWGLNKIQDLGVKQKEEKPAPKVEKVKKEKSLKPESLSRNYFKEEGTKEVGGETVAWIITKMDFQEFEFRYKVKTPKTMMEDNAGSYLFEVSIPDSETLKRIQSELRKGEFCRVLQ
jgi:hypothetical protein